MRAQSFLFDGIKELDPVGNHKEETLKLSDLSNCLVDYLSKLN